MAELHTGMVTLAKTNGGQFEDGGAVQRWLNLASTWTVASRGLERIKNNEGFGESYFGFVSLKQKSYK